MAEVLKKRRLVNPGRRRRRMTPKQIKYFGTPRQKAALKNHRRRNASIRTTKKRLKKSGEYTGYIGRTYRRAGRIGRATRRMKAGTLKRPTEFRRAFQRKARNQGGILSRAESAAKRAIRSVEDAAEDAIGAVTRQVNRRKNVGEILTVIPANPGRRRKTMARRTRRRVAVANRHHRRRRNPRVVVRYRNRRHRLHNRRGRRNQGALLQGNMGAVVGVLGGAAVTKIITGFLPAQFQTGWGGTIATGLVAVLTGQVAGQVLKNKSLGNWVTVGGLVIVGLQLAGMFGFPNPFGTAGTSGMGLITSSNFYVPQVNLPGSMASFVTPAGIPQPVVIPATAMRGIGATGVSAMNYGLRRVGRLR